MAEYRVQGESLTAVADPIRELSGVTDLLSLAGMTEKVDEANAEVTTQAGLMEQIKSALEGKAGGGGGIIPEGTLEITENGTYDVTQYAEAVVNVPTGGGGYGYVFENTVNLAVATEVLVPLTYQVQTVEGATYGFAMSGGWWVSQNAGVASSFAMCKVLFNFEEETTVTLKCINYAQKGYDYGLISVVDTMLALDNTADSEGVLKSFVDSNSSSAVEVPVTIPAGEHFLCVKFRKSASTDSNNDSLKFAVTL